jgi:phage replication initiation protein
LHTKHEQDSIRGGESGRMLGVCSDVPSAGACAPSGPRIVTTRETRSEGVNPTTPLAPGEFRAFCQSERVEFATDGRRSIITLHPVPLDAASPNVAHVDWLSLTVHPPIAEGRGVLNWLMKHLKEVCCLPAPLIHDTRKGWNGYEHRFEICEAGRDGVKYGLFAFGGKRQRGTAHISLNAQACARIKDWNKVSAWGKTVHGKITRLDLAHDDLQGETFTMGNMVEWYSQGKFNAGGRQPASFLHGDWPVAGSPDGRTMEIGRRINGKMLRIYEKGKQLGDRNSPWVRVELELRGKNRLVPWEAVSEPGKYLAGSYPCLNFLTLRQEKIKTISKAAAISYEDSVTHARSMCGKLVNVMMQENGGDAFEVVNQLKRDGVPERLKNYVEHLPMALGNES